MTNPISISVSTSLYSSLRFDVESPITLDSDAAHKIVESIKANNSVPSIELLSCYRWDFNATNDSIIQQMILASKQAEIECRSEGDLDNFKSRNREAIACVLETNSCNYSSRQDYYAQELHDAFDFEDIRTALEDAEVEIIEEESDFEGVLFCLLLEAVEEADKSSINCLFGGRRYSAEIVFTPSFNWTEESSEDTDMFVHLDSDGGFTTEGVVELMQMANVGRSELEAYIAESELDLYDGARESLNKIHFEADPTKDNILSPKLTWIVLENAPRGGVPTFTCYVDACEFLNRDITKDMTFSKGVLGLEDTIWGSGHNESIQSDFTIPAGNTNWHTLSKHNIRNEVYCFSISSIKSDIGQK